MKMILFVALLAATSAWGQVVNPPTSTATATNVSGGGAGGVVVQNGTSTTGHARSIARREPLCRHAAQRIREVEPL